MEGDENDGGRGAACDCFDGSFAMPKAVVVIWILSACFGVLALVTHGREKWIWVGILTILIFILLIIVRRIGGTARGKTTT